MEAISGNENVEDFIIAEKIITPVDWQADFNCYRYFTMKHDCIGFPGFNFNFNYRGTAFGLAHGLNQLNFLRAKIRHPKYKNLYRCGASCKPGNGVPLVMVGAKLTAECMSRDAI
jgi:hypothetical protein